MTQQRSRASVNLLVRTGFSFQMKSWCEATELLSVDSVPLRTEVQVIMITEEFLNSRSPAGLPPHCLRLKVGMPVMLLRNLHPQRGDCNGTRYVIRSLQLVECIPEARYDYCYLIYPIRGAGAASSVLTPSWPTLLGSLTDNDLYWYTIL
jgi:hypothetical protein